MTVQYNNNNNPFNSPLSGTTQISQFQKKNIHSLFIFLGIIQYLELISFIMATLRSRCGHYIFAL